MGDGFQPGQEFTGRYRLSGELAQGPSGPVFLAEEGATGTRVAAKFLTRVDPAATGAIVEGARAWQGVRHPNLVAVLGVGISGGTPYLVYELVEGAGVPRLLEKHGRLAPAAALRIARGLAEAIAVLHGRGLRHGAVVANHVLLDRKGTPKLAEGGLAGLHPGDAAGDLRALGALCHRMLAGQDRSPGGGSLAAFLEEVPLALDGLVEELVTGRVPDAAGAAARLRELLETPDVGSRKQAYPPRSAAGQPIATGAAAPAVGRSASAPVLPTAPTGPATPAAPPAPRPASSPTPVLDLGGSAPSADIFDYEESKDALPVVGPSRDQDFHQRKARAVVEATNRARKKPPPPRLQVQVGQRDGPGFGQFMLILLAGGVAVGGLGWFAFHRPEFGIPDRIRTATGGRVETSGTSSAPRTLEKEPETPTDFQRAIIEEHRLHRRQKLVKALVREHPGEAAEALKVILRGGNDRLRKQVFRFLVPLDEGGEHRLELMRWAADHEGNWPLRVATSLADDGHLEELAEIGEREGWGALLAAVAATRGRDELPHELADRLEARFFAPGEVRQRELVGDWLQAGGTGSPVTPWLASTLLHRATSPDERLAVLEPMAELEPSPVVFDALEKTLGAFGFAWDHEVSRYGLQVLVFHAGVDAARQARFQKLERRF